MDSLEDRAAFPVSLVVPVRNEANSIVALLESIAAQTRQPDEIIFVDGGSTDSTAAILRRAASSNSRIRVIETSGATPGKGRNIGIEAADSDWIALTDAGISLDRRWLEQLVAAARMRPKAGIVYGAYEPRVTTFFERCAKIAYVTPREDHDGFHLRAPFIASSLVRRDDWRRVGGFPDLRAAEDLIFIERLEGAGSEAAWAPDAVVVWELQPDLVSTFRRFALYSKHNVWAGRERNWHYGVARVYLVMTPFIIAAIVDRPAWLAIPLAILAFRTARRISRHRESHGLGWLLNPLQFLGVAGILMALDIATFAGWVQALLPTASRNATQTLAKP